MPLINSLHVDKLLSNVSVMYRNGSYVAAELFPIVAVQNFSDLYRVYDRNFRIPETKRATRGVAHEFTFDVSNASYLLEWHSLRDFVSDRQARNFDGADLRAATTENLTDAILRRMEKSCAALMTGTSWSLTLSLTSVAAWNATTTLDPVTHYDTATSVLLRNSGKAPNVTGMGRDAWVTLKNNTVIIDRVKYTSRELSEAVVGSLIGIPNLYVSAQVEDTAHEGASGGANIQSLWNDAVFVGYRPANPGPLEASAGYIFQANQPMVKRYREEDRESDVIEVNKEYQIKVVASLAGLIIKDVI